MQILNCSVLFLIECKLNVHKRCTRNVANDCGLDKKKLADALANLNISTEPHKMVNLSRIFYLFYLNFILFSHFHSVNLKVKIFNFYFKLKLFLYFN